MATFCYKALDQGGKSRSGRIEAGGRREAAASLRAQSLYPLEVKQTAEGIPVFWNADEGGDSESPIRFRWLRRMIPVSSQDLVFFFRQLAVMLRSGLPLLSSLEVCRKQRLNLRLEESIDFLMREIQRGGSFSQCMARLKGVFPVTAIKLIQSGEASGEIDPVLDRVASYIQRRAEIRTRLLTSLSYPTIVVISAFGVAGFLTWKVIPKFARYFAKRQIALPTSTQILMDISGFVQDYGLWFVVLALSLAGGAVAAWRTRRGRLFLSRAILRIPVVGKVVEVAAMAQVGRTLSMLLGSGLNMTESLQAASATTGNEAFRTGLAMSVNRILRGKSLSESLDRAWFPPLVRQMASIGEKTGELPDALGQMGEFYENELQARIQRMSALIEPAILLLIGGMVGFVYFAFFKAVFQIAAR